MEDKKPKKLAPAAAMWAKMSPEERADFIARRSVKIKAGQALKREEQLKKKQLELQKQENKVQKFGGAKDEIAIKKVRNELLKMTDKNFVPTFEVLNTAICLAKEGKDLEAIRQEFFKAISQDTWVRFKKMMFALQITSPEDLGNELLISRDRIKAQIQKEIDKMRVLQKDRPGLYHDKIAKMLSYQHQIEMDTSKRLVDIGAVGQKRQGGIAIQIINNIPRPDRPLAHEKRVQPQYITTAPKELNSKGAEDIEVMTVVTKKEEASA